MLISKDTSSRCPIWGDKLSSNGYRELKCRCGLVTNRDVIGSWNVRLRGLKSLKIDVGSSVHPESPSMKPEAGRFSATKVSKATKVAENQNGLNVIISELVIVKYPLYLQCPSPLFSIMNSNFQSIIVCSY